MKGTLISFLLLIGSCCFGQQRVINDPNIEKRTVSGFHSIHVDDGIDLYLTQTDEEAVAVSAAKEKDRGKIRTEAKDGVLYIYMEGSINIIWGNRRLRAYVSAKTLKLLRAAGGSDVWVQAGGIKADDFSLSVSGGSDFRGAITATNLQVKASGGSDVHLSGKAVNMRVSASGGSDFHGYDMDAENVFVSVSGGSDARVTATHELGAEASGGSDVHYKGNAVLKYKSASGGGEVTKRGR